MRHGEIASAKVMDASSQRLERGVVHGNDGRETTSHESTTTHNETFVVRACKSVMGPSSLP